MASPDLSETEVLLGAETKGLQPKRSRWIAAASLGLVCAVALVANRTSEQSNRGPKTAVLQDGVSLAAENACSANGESCAESKCCEDASMTCFEKHEHWAMCNSTCSPNMLWEGGKWVEKKDTVWTCKNLTNPCSANGESCADSKCCEDPSMTCYEKHEHWAMCNSTCSPNMLWEGGKWVEKKEKQWTCKDLEKPVATNPCSVNGKSCAESKCCEDPSMTCFEKHDHWAMCNTTCSPNMLWEGGKWVEKKDKQWTCKNLTNPCSANGESCADSKCCEDPSMTCYEKHEHWAMCNSTCSPNMLWEGGKWVEKKEKQWTCKDLEKPVATNPCSVNGKSCAESKCCEDPSMSCFEKHDHWAMCNTTCSPNMLWEGGKWVEKKDKQWTCKNLTVGA